MINLLKKIYLRAKLVVNLEKYSVFDVGFGNSC